MQVYPDRAARKEIETLKFHCHYVGIGCPWVGTLKQLEEHAAQCAYKGVNCPHSGCDVCTTAKLLEEHVKECAYREISCKFCRTVLPSCQLAVSNSCELFIQLCVNNVYSTIEHYHSISVR